ncbi:MAG: substrate-binding domain-containing protein [Armatimonadota bacterium]
MKSEGELRNQLRAVRTRLGLSQQELAAAAGITRQTVGGIEGELYAPSASVALKLARALGCRVEELFWLDGDPASVPAVPAEGLPEGDGLRIALARVGARWVAHPLLGDDAVREEMVPCDGLAAHSGGGAVVRLLDDAGALERTVALAGCTPALSLWARAAERWHPGLRVHWSFANSSRALASLARGEVHLAGLHLCDPRTGEFNTPFVRAALRGRAVTLVNLGTWEEGFLVRASNPLGLRGGADLARPDVRLVNREAGAGSRLLLDETLAAAGVSPDGVRGYTETVRGHWEVARAVASGAADVGVSTATVALAYGLGFLPLREVRYDLAVLNEYREHEPVRQLLATLGHRWIRSQLGVLGGYDTTRTGEVVAEVAA